MTLKVVAPGHPQPPGEALSARVLCDDGWGLEVALRLPAGAARAVAVCGHAMMVDRRTLDARGDGLVSALAAAGIAVVWPDLRGHGASGPRAEAGGAWSYDDLVERDTPALYAFARARFPHTPLYAVGHSLFGHVSLAHLARHPEAPVDGLVLLAANVWLRQCEPDERAWRRKQWAVRGFQAVTRLFGRFPARRLRIGSNDEAAAYMEQIGAWAGRGDWHAGDGFSWWRALPLVRRPLLAIAGAGDALLARPASAAAFVAAIPGADFRLGGRARDVDGGARRIELPFDPGHMALVTDPRSRPLWDEIARWILDRASAARGGPLVHHGEPPAR